MQEPKLQIIADTIEYNGEAVARITVDTSTLRDGFEALLLSSKAPLDLVTADFVQTIRNNARKFAQASAITLKELDAILDIAMDK